MSMYGDGSLGQRQDLSFSFPMSLCCVPFFFLESRQSFKSKVLFGSPDPPPEYYDPLIPYYRRNISVGWTKLSQAVRRCNCSSMKLSLQAPHCHLLMAFPQTSPLYVRHMLLLKLLANYRGLNDLTPPLSLLMIHIISISISIIQYIPQPPNAESVLFIESSEELW